MSANLKINDLKTETRKQLFEYCLRLADDNLILGQRLAEWCGHAPILEEDIALTNIALDCIGQATALLTLAAEVEDKGRTADDLAFLREAVDFRNVELVEQPNGDFAFTIVRQFIFNAFNFHLYQEMQSSKFEPLAGIAQKSFKEVTYHLRHSSAWLRRLGDGTEESHKRAQQALERIWLYASELFYSDEVDKSLVQLGIAPELKNIETKWSNTVSEVVTTSTLQLPSKSKYLRHGARLGRHSEHLGHLLAEMQILPRSFPGAQW